MPAWSLQLYLPPVDGWIENRLADEYVEVYRNYREKLVAVAAGRAAAIAVVGGINKQ